MNKVANLGPATLTNSNAKGLIVAFLFPGNAMVVLSVPPLQTNRTVILHHVATTSTTAWSKMFAYQTAGDAMGHRIV